MATRTDEIDVVGMYLSRIGAASLLNREQEVIISKAIESARKAVLDALVAEDIGQPGSSNFGLNLFCG